MNDVELLIRSRHPLIASTAPLKRDCEGGCGVIGLACEKQIAGKHLLTSLCQMKNRGNGKGGGIAAVGLSPEQWGVTQKVLENDYLLAIAYLEPGIRSNVEEAFVTPVFEVDHIHEIKKREGVPDVVLYFVRVQPQLVKAFRLKNGLENLSQAAIEDEIVYQNSYQLNLTFYAESSDKKAFVLSHGKNLLVLKCIGYADEVITGYHLEECKAHVWIGHHRYPTRGRLWHPAGAHPFIGMHEALIHNGDLANYSSLQEYLVQRNIHPLFVTDTEVAALLFDLLTRVYGYPLEYTMEALAPTTELDFSLLPGEKQSVYDLIQKTHLHASPDGPWFFLIARSLPHVRQLIGITDTSMLRPQVFAFQKGEHAIGLVASEKQAINALLLNLSQEDSSFWPSADLYWRSRGGSYTDGGAFTFTLKDSTLSCTNKFGEPISLPNLAPVPQWGFTTSAQITFPDHNADDLISWVEEQLPQWNYEQGAAFLYAVEKSADTEANTERAFAVLTELLNHPKQIQLRRSFWRALVERSIGNLITKNHLQRKSAHLAIIDARQYAPEGENSLAREIVRLYEAGIRKWIIGHCAGHRFIGSGLGPNTRGVEIHVYGSSGDYLGSGIDGAEIRVHNHAQDQLGQIMKNGKLIIYGDVGQAFMYGAKGGIAYVRGSAAGRALINAVGGAKFIINGTALDYLAESCMAGNPLQRGGFVIINAIAFNAAGDIVDVEPPYPGGNLFSLASGGAIYFRDPARQIGAERLNGGICTDLTPEDVALIRPYLEENARLFRIPISRLLQRDGRELTFQEAYRKIVPTPPAYLNPEAAWVAEPSNPEDDQEESKTQVKVEDKNLDD